MIRKMIHAVCLMPLGLWAVSIGCGVTDRQLADFAVSTGINVFVQSVVSMIGAAILQNFGTV